MFYPIYLDLQGRACLVVGGGPIATGKVRGLIEAGALVTVVAPEASEAIVSWAEARAVVWHRRDVLDTDVDGQFLVSAATDDRDLNARRYRLADRAGRVASPALAKQIRDRVQRDVLTPETATLAAFLGSWRAEVKRRIDTYERRQALWEGVLEGCVPVRVVAGDREAADSAMQEFLVRSARPHDEDAVCVLGNQPPGVCRACKGV